MLSSVIHDCPRCGGAINPEHYAEHRIEEQDRTDEFLYCEYCERGWERSVYDDGEVFSLDYWHRCEPKNFALFLGRLEAARVA